VQVVNLKGLNFFWRPSFQIFKLNRPRVTTKLPFRVFFTPKAKRTLFRLFFIFQLSGENRSNESDENDLNKGCQIFIGTRYQNGGEVYQSIIKYTTMQLNIPNGHKINPMAMKASSIVRPSKIYPNW
jgi:hypothetical protein